MSGTGSFTILSVKHRLDHGSEAALAPESKSLDARAVAIERTIADGSVQIGTLQHEESRLRKNESIASGSASTVDQLRAFHGYHRERISAVRTGVLERQRRVEERKEEARRIQLQVGQLRAKKPNVMARCLPTWPLLVAPWSSEMRATHTG